MLDRDVVLSAGLATEMLSFTGLVANLMSLKSTCTMNAEACVKFCDPVHQTVGSINTPELKMSVGPLNLHK